MKYLILKPTESPEAPSSTSPNTPPNPHSTLLIKYEDVLEYVTRRPGLLTGDAILDYYEESFKKPLELWNGNKKVS